MSENRVCPDCGCEIPTSSPVDLCPKCMLRAGLQGQSAVDAASDPTVTDTAELYEPPADLVARFPQLEIVKFLGKGGMGTVYLAKQRGLDRLVALKVLRSELSQDPSFAERFTREARAMAKLNHPNIVAVHDFGQADGLCYLLMEYVEGTNLRHLIQAGSMSPREALSIVPQICDALQFAHNEGIVHRDIKPENILIDMRGKAKIADFGLAKLLGDDVADMVLTATNQIMGTPRYMAPEQIEATRNVDHRADIYSLGVVFYEMLTGELPLGRFAPPSQKVGIDVRLDEVVLRTLEKEPDRRYQHASDVKDEVEDIQSHATVVEVEDDASSITLEQRAQAKRLVWGPAVGVICAGVLNCALFVIMVLAPLGWFFYSSGSPPNRQIGPPHSFEEHFDSPMQRTSLRLHAAFAKPAVLMPTASDQPTWMKLFLILLVVVLWSFIGGITTVLGGFSMLHLKSYGFAHVGAILAMLPCTPGFVIGLPCGVWALLVLHRAEVKVAFAH